MDKRILVGLLILTFSCRQKSNDIIHDNIQDSIVVVNSNPTTGTLKEPLKFDTLETDEFDKLFTSSELKTYDIIKNPDLKKDLRKSYDFWKSKRLLINDTLKELNIWGYPISIKEINTNVRRLTTITQMENMTKIAVFTIDKNFNTIDINELTSFGGEGEYTESFGQFINDSLYRYEQREIDLETNKIEWRLHQCLTFHKDGRIEKKENCR